MARTALSHAPPSAAPAAAPKSPSIDEARSHWRDAFRRVRAETEKRAAHLSAEDQIVQSMADASPTKWHRAHVTWFFEQFLLVPNDPTYKIFDQRFPFLFNSYYVAAGPRHARPQRGLITRPNSEDVAGYRAHVDAAVERLIENVPAAEADASSRSSRSACITSSSTRNFCSPISCTPSRRTRPTRSMTPAGRRRARRTVRAALSMCRPAFTRSDTKAGGSASTTRCRGTTNSSPMCGSRVISSAMPNGSRSLTPAAMRRPRSGCRTAGPRCRRKAGRRPAIGGNRTASGSR